MPKPLRLPARRALARVESIRLRGDDVECPCCGSTFARFAVHDGTPNERCPNCWSLPRTRLMLLYLQRAGLIDPRLSVLHIAPEDGLWRQFRRFSNYRTADLTDGVRISNVMSVENIPFADETFDLIICSHVLEHVRDDARALREFQRVLKAGGRALLQHPIDYSLPTTLDDPSIVDPPARREAYGQHDHVRLFGADFARRIEAAGFAVTVVEPKDFAADRHRFAIHDDGAIRSADIFVATPR